jgi:triosephosphate isomerase
LLIAYEPVWAIGTGLTATPDQVNDMHAVIKAEVTTLLGEGSDIPVLYGGSVNPETAEALLGCPQVNGALVGGASLDPASFAQIARSALNSLSY